MYDWQKKTWIQRNRMAGEMFSGKLIMDKLLLLEKALEPFSIDYSKKLYPYFSLGYINNRVEPFVKAPLLLFIQVPDSDKLLFAEFMHEDGMFLLSEVQHCPAFDYMLEQQQRMSNNHAYEMELNKVYKYVELLAVTSHPEVMAGFIAERSGHVI